MRVPWTARRSKSILKDISPEYSLEGLMLKLKLQYFGHLLGRVNSLHQVAKVLELQLHINPSNEYSGLIPLGLTGLISLLSKVFSRVFSSNTI